MTFYEDLKETDPITYEYCKKIEQARKQLEYDIYCLGDEEDIYCLGDEEILFIGELVHRYVHGEPLDYPPKPTTISSEQSYNKK